MLRLIRPAGFVREQFYGISKHLMLRLIFDNTGITDADHQFQNILCYG